MISLGRYPDYASKSEPSGRRRAILSGQRILRDHWREKILYFVICGDIVKGNKLLVSMVNFYGRLVLIDQNEAIIRIK